MVPGVAAPFPQSGLATPHYLASAMGAYLFYAQHNFPEAYVQPRETWTFVRASLESSSYMKLGPVLNYFTGNIGYHRNYLALLSAGAYGFVMASNYNTRSLAAEVLVSGKKSAVVRERQRVKKIWAGEKVAPWLR